MIPFLPGRRPDDPDAQVHARAMRLSAERISDRLPAEEEAWLSGHLDACESCREVAAAYEAESLMLRSQPAPEAPRDLWARTSAAIEADRSRSFRLPSLIPLGALSGALVVAAVVGASLLSTPATFVAPSAPPLPSTAIASPSPGATPFAVSAGEVGWVLQQPDGTYSLAYAPVEQVCPVAIRPDCPALADPSPGALKLQTAPSAIVGAPVGNQLVVLDAKTATTGGALYVVAVPSPTPTPAASPSASASGSVPSQTASPSPSSSPAASASPASGAIAIANDVIIVGLAAAYSPDGRWFAFSARPSDGSRGPDIYVWSAGDALAHPVTTDHRSVFSGWSGGYIVGSRAVVLGADGSPATTAPAGSPAASGAPASPSPGASPSAAPAGSSPSAAASPSPSDAVPSPSPSPSPTSATAVSFLLDPATGASADVPGTGIWRPVVDPSGTYVAYWDGTLRLAGNGVDWIPDSGRLVLARWTGGDIVPLPSSSPGPSASASPEPSLEPTPSPSPSAEPVSSPPTAPSPSPTPAVSPSPSPSASPLDTASPSMGPSPSPTPVILPAALSDASVREWDIRWDETGTRLAVWVADPVDGTIGTLTLHTLDRSSDTLDGGGLLLKERPALPGFSIGAGRLAWATPPGQGGEGSRVEVLVWRGDTAGQIESKPATGEGAVVIIR